MNAIDTDSGVSQGKVYDIIIGDFGRLASAQYTVFLTNLEKQIIQERKDRKTTGFFDEERRIMFDLCCDIAWLKKSTIAEDIAQNGFVTKDVLYGIGPDSIRNEILEKGIQLVKHKIQFALERGYKRIRVYAVCNGLSDIVRDIVSESVSLVSSTTAHKNMLSEDIYVLSDERMVEFHSVPYVVAKSISRSTEISPILILGTRGVNEIYENLVIRMGGSLYLLKDNDYELIDDAILAAIGDEPENVLILKKRLAEKLVNKFKNEYMDGLVVEACTDFNFGLGINSLKIFAEEMVLNVYGKR